MTGHGDPQAEFFAFEACEYRRHFLAYSPDYVIMTILILIIQIIIQVLMMCLPHFNQWQIK